MSELKTEDVLEILLGSQFECKKFEVEVEKVKSLWGIFKWGSAQGKGFKHLPKSFELMAKMLVRVRLFKEIEFLLYTMDCEGIQLDSDEIFSNLIEGYVGAGELNRAISVYDQLRRQALVPSRSCYRAILDFLVEKNETHLALRVCTDMVEMGLGLSGEGTGICENVIKLLCRDGKVQEARNLVRKVVAVGFKPSNSVIDEIASEYCEKRDYDDLLKFLVETDCALDVVVGNKVIFLLCRNFGVERANWFVQELENVDFRSDEITFGILIGWSCHEGKLQNAFVYLSEMLSRSLKPDVRSYNALIGGVFKEGMWKHAREILSEMHDVGVKPSLDTYKALLAGYSGARQFDEVKAVVGEMIQSGLIQPSSVSDFLLTAFMLLGLDPMKVKVRRDNDLGFSKTEFYDNLGNGLYLEADLSEYEKAITAVLEDSFVPDFNSVIMKDCTEGNYRTAVLMVEEMVRWGQELSPTSFSVLVKELCASNYNIKTIASLVDKMPKLTTQLDEDTLNVLVQALSRKGFTKNAMKVFGAMRQRHLTIKTETYTALCKKRKLMGLLSCLEISKQDKWLPELKNSKALAGYLLEQGLLEEALELFDKMWVAYPHIRLNICHDFFEKLCSTGFTSVAHALAEEVQKQGTYLDHVAHSHLVKGFFKEKMFSKAFIVLDAMLAKNLVPCFDVAILSVTQLCWAGKLESAVALKQISLREQSPVSVSNSVYCSLISGFCKSGMVMEAENILRDMVIRRLVPDCETLNALVQGYCQIQNLRKVGELLSVMIRKSIAISISSYSKLVCLLCTRGRVHSAQSLKELMLRESNPLYLVIYNILIFYLFQTRKSEFVDALLDELQEKALQLDGFTYNFLVFGYSCCKQLPLSLHYLITMMSEGHRPSNRAMRTIISSLCGDGEFGKALELSREMESRGWVVDSTILNAIVEGLLDEGKIQEAIRYLDRMVEKGLISHNATFDKIIKQFCMCGRVDKAVDFLDIMLKKGNIPSSSTYDCLIHDSCTCHELDRALDFLTEMLDRNLNPSIKTWNVLIHNICQFGEITEAERLLTVMVQMGETPTMEMYCSVINRYHSEKNLSKASKILQTMQQFGYEPDFATHWSLISNLSSNSRLSSAKNSGNDGRPFLSRLLSESGFAQKKDHNAKL